ncbi:MAG: MBL fold metallo-hydrolase [Ruminococcus sp.]|nr:MBL fold metallo-hydrolase [Ruminococcus sp.]
MELIKITDNTYYIKNPTNIGIYKLNNDEVYLIDSGNDKEAGKKILKIINDQGWTVKGIINTHSNADHIGGNRLIQNRTNCHIYANNIEKSFTENPILEPSFLYGGYPFKDIRNKFLQAESSKCLPISEITDLEYFSLKGHFFDMIGLKTKDDVYFIGDALFGEETINKYHIFFIYDVKEYLNTLDYLSTLKGKLFIASHIEPTENITNLININRNKILEISDKIYSLCINPITFEDIVQSIFNSYNLIMNANQYVLVGSTIKSYLSYLYDENKITFEFVDNKMYWKQKTLS